MDGDDKKVPRQESLDATQLKETKSAGLSDMLIDQSLEPYCQPGVRGIFASRYVALCAIFATMGGLLFGYDQGS